MSKKEMLEWTENWYNNNRVKYAMMPFLKNRELAFITPSWARQGERNTRTMRCHNIQSQRVLREWIGADRQETFYNYYYSLAEYKEGLPIVSLNMDKRKEQTKEWIEVHHKTMSSYDFMIDIDGIGHDEENFEYTKESARLVKKFLDGINIPYYLRFSGNGFHFIIPYNYMTFQYSLNPHSEAKTIYQFYYLIAKKMYEEFTELIDYKIYDSRRVCKIPFSLALYEDNIYVCTPINSDLDFETFQLYNALPDNVLPNIQNLEPQLFNKSDEYWTHGIRILTNLKIKWGQSKEN